MIDVLVVEDNRALGELLCDFLKAEGYQTALAPTGEEGLALARREGARLVVLDVMLPGMDGLAVCRALRQEGDLPILVVSARSEKEDKLAGLRLGADDYIEKPYDVDILLAKIRGMGTAGCDPRLMGLGPVYAVPKALENAGLTMDDIQLIELNEAFAAQSLGCIKLLGWEDKMDIINVNGGAIALGHPVGSSGCRIIVSLVHEMKRRGLKYGLATLCIAGGMGQATVIEMCD